MQFSWRRFAFYSSMIAAICTAFGEQAQAQSRVRKNIDSLSAAELADYAHALTIVKARPPSRKDSYGFFAALHNTRRVGPCEHARDTFLPWHRLHLLAFEDVLRAADPPRTANVTIPYWDWSQLPSGRRYPKAFETERALQPPQNTSRNATPICKEGTPKPCTTLPFPWSYLDAEVLSVSTWSSAEKPDQSFGGASNGALSCEAREDVGLGALEAPAHNAMHSVYIQGPMGLTTTASNDPIYWSYHAFIDLLWDNWQRRPGNKTDTCLDCSMCLDCGSGTCTISKKVSEVEKSKEQLGVEYDHQVSTVTAAARVRLAEGAPKPLTTIDVARSASVAAAAFKTQEIEIPASPVQSAIVVIKDVNITSPISYQINVYFYPNTGPRAYNPRDRAFRARSLVYFNSIWTSHHAEHGHGGKGPTLQAFQFDLAPWLNAAMPTNAGEKWTLRVETVPTEQQPATAPKGVTPKAAARAQSSALQFGDVIFSIK